MMLVYSILIVLGTTWTVSSTGRCFELTWNVKNVNRTANCMSESMKDRPCVLPIFVTDDDKPPDVNDIWYHGNRTAYSCPLAKGLEACVKYSYIYNDAVEHISYFCGKVTENNQTAITSGCYTSKDRGYTIEVCACVTEGDDSTFPCNASGIAYVSIHLLVVAALVSMINDNIFFEKVHFFYAQ